MFEDWLKEDSELLREKLKIDKDNLDFEIIAQPELYYEAANACAMAGSVRDRAYENAKQVDAQLYLEVRSEIESAGKKATETMIENFVQNHIAHKEAKGVWAEAKAEADTLAALRDAFQQRGYMLRDLVQLIVTGYYAERPMSEDSSHVRTYKQDSKEQRVRDSRRSRLDD